uniref:Uncharacterized protein n=1 Tax=Gossypium raimondii TaxID=29730 RepID=A0A0D2MH88_GOSRA|nr:hypothetical protein B456_003G000400 [Gossypium raimondii]
MFGLASSEIDFSLLGFSVFRFKEPLFCSVEIMYLCGFFVLFLSCTICLLFLNCLFRSARIVSILLYCYYFLLRKLLLVFLFVSPLLS